MSKRFEGRNGLSPSADGVPVCKKCALSFSVVLGRGDAILSENFG